MAELFEKVILRLLPTAAATIAVYGVWKAARFLLRPYFSPIRDLPGPKSRGFIWGNLKEIQKAEAQALHEKWVEEYGPTMKYKGFFGTDRLFTVDTRAINHVLTHSADYQKPSQARFNLSRVLGNGILVTEGEKHRQQRRVMNPSFGPSSIRDLTPIFFRKATELRDVWVKEVNKSEGPAKIEVLSWLSRTTLDIIGLAGFNYKFNALNVNEEANELNKAFSLLFHADNMFSFIRLLQAFFPIFRLIPTKRERNEQQAQRTMWRIGEELLQERKNNILGEKAPISEDVEHDTADMNGRDLLTALVRSNLDTELPASQRMSDEDVLAQVPTFLVAGHETTSTETMWALFSLSQRQDLQKRLRTEVLSVPTESPDMDTLASLPFLDAVVRETLRVHAAVPSTIRVAVRDDVIPVSEPYMDRKGIRRDSIPIRKGEAMFIPILAMNRIKSIWGEDAREFNPDRWSKIPDAATSIPGVWGNMLTFLGGARSCIGYRFALIEMKALLFTLIRAFEFELAVPAEDVEKRSMIVTRPYLRSEKTAGAQMPLIVRRYVPESPMAI